MLRRGSHGRVVGFLVGVVVAMGATGDRLAAQAPVPCRAIFCGDPQGFGSCNVGATAGSMALVYPGEAPGSAARVPVGDQTLLYVADLFEGRTYRYSQTTGPVILNPLSFQDSVRSPGGSRRVTGIAYNSNDMTLYWAVGGDNNSAEAPNNPRVLESAPDLSTAQSFDEAPEIDMVLLASLLELPEVGELGGIAVHETRNSFWGVDITNDIYFEFDSLGQPVVEGGEVVHFVSPAAAGGSMAFGNSISYVRIGEQEFFDIPVGSGADGGVSHVTRVFASATETAAGPVTFGDPVGLGYRVAPALGAHGFLSGVFQWQDICGPDQNVAIVLDQGSAFLPAAMSVLATDTPPETDWGIAGFTCAADGPNVHLEWNFHQQIAALTLSRVDLRTQDTVTVAEFTDQAVGSYAHDDERVPDGVYEYRLQAGTLPASTCVATVGRGTVEGSVPFARDDAPMNRSPFAVTYIGSLDRLLVVDLRTGAGHTFTADLEPRTAFAGPFADLEFANSLKTGVAWLPGEDELVWLARLDGQHFLRRTTLVTDELGEVTSVTATGPTIALQTPPALTRTPLIGDISYDSVGDQLWMADAANGVAFAARPDGSLSPHSVTQPLPNPRGENGLAGGGISVADSTAEALTLDWIAGAAAGSSVASEMVTLSYARALDDEGNETIQVPGVEANGVDLRYATGSSSFGGLETMATGAGAAMGYVVGLDTGRIYRFALEGGISGRTFIRGDVNGDGALNISDPSFLLNHVFRGGEAPPCLDAADATDDEVLDQTDAVFLFSYLFLSGEPPAEPFMECGFDLEPGLTCDATLCTP